MTRVLRCVLVVFLCCAVPAGANTYSPVDVPFNPNAADLKQVSKAIKWTLLERRWSVDKETETTIQATITKPDDQISLTVLITFDVAKANISYVTSQEPGRTRRDGKPARLEPISESKYEGWVENLAKDIPVYLRRLQIILSNAAQPGVPADAPALRAGVPSLAALARRR